jgi:hypothetical protein
MKHKLSRISMVLSTSGLIAAGLASSAYAATPASAQTPSWHTVLSVPTNQFETVIATGRTSAWAFEGGSAYERTGATWRTVAFPGNGGEVNVAGASSPSNVWVAYETGSGKPTVLYRWDGTNWLGAGSFYQGGVTAISVLGPRDVWVFGNGTYHFDGSSWTELSATAEGGSATSDNNVWEFTGQEMTHYNGQKWTTTNLASLLPAPLAGHPASSLSEVLALAPNNVYATGEGNTTPRGGPGVVLHYDGRSWTRVAEGDGFIAVGGNLASDGNGGLWIAAQDFPARYPSLFHYSGGQLTAVNLGATSLSVSLIPGTTEALSGGWQATGGGQSVGVVQQYS